jgi:glucosamine--fructose-6-phosphate aminotransferase (isomerizing)
VGPGDALDDLIETIICRSADGITVIQVRHNQRMERRVQTLMAQEIAEQPAAIAATLDSLRPLRERIAQLAASRHQILFVARGSSDNAAIYGRYLLEVHAGRTGAPAAPSVATHYRRELDLSGALVVSISQSGRTGEIVQPLACSLA